MTTITIATYITIATTTNLHYESIGGTHSVSLVFNLDTAFSTTGFVPPVAGCNSLRKVRWMDVCHYPTKLSTRPSCWPINTRGDSALSLHDRLDGRCLVSTVRVAISGKWGSGGGDKIAFASFNTGTGNSVMDLNASRWLPPPLTESAERECCCVWRVSRLSRVVPCCNLLLLLLLLAVPWSEDVLD
jgi:hypothetical protein